MTRNELLAYGGRMADGGSGRAFDLGGVADIVGDVSDIIRPFLPRPPALPGTAARPPMLPAPGGGVPAGIGGMIRGVGRGAGGFAKTVGVLVAAGLTTEMAVRLISSGAVKVGGRRRRGITAAQLTGFNKVCSLIRRVGMHPKAIHRAPRKKGCK